ADLQHRLTVSVDALRAAVIADDMRQFSVLLRGRQGIDKLFDGVLRLFGRHTTRR
ncbi:MAG: glycerol acyltransferase, partial [Chloroflexaceae bacterium]|nr:glycerol acyltransferase [Chloroflexaceae bacterium]